MPASRPATTRPRRWPRSAEPPMRYPATGRSSIETGRPLRRHGKAGARQRAGGGRRLRGRRFLYRELSTRTGANLRSMASHAARRTYLMAGKADERRGLSAGSWRNSRTRPTALMPERARRAEAEGLISRAPQPPCEAVSEQLEEQARAEEVRRDESGQRAQLDDVRPDDLALGEHLSEEFERLPPVQPPGSGVPTAGMTAGSKPSQSIVT